MHNIIGQWVPPNERSKFATASIGSSIGLATFYPIFGYILSTLTWEFIFYLSGLIGIIWFIVWHNYAYDSPALHPTIHPYERAYIQESLGYQGQSNKNVYFAILFDNL